jgi:phospholipid transport system substrate-binding protein
VFVLKRLVLATGLALAALPALPAAAQVAAPGAEAADPAAGAFIEKLSGEAFAVLRDDSLSKQARRAKFRAMLEQNVALTDIGNRLIRRQRATITPAQYSAYQAALPEFILNAYTDRLSAYENASVKVVRTVARNASVTDVYAKVSQPGQQPIDTIWQVKKSSSGKMLLSNLTASGINLALTQEADFNAYIQKNGFDALVAFLKNANSKAATARTAG